MIKFIKEAKAKSVFRKMPDDYTMSDIFAALFHRLAATTYLIYSGWAVLVLLNGVPSMVRQQGTDFTTIFAVFVLLTVAPACFGATYFPQAARTELFAGASFIMLMIIYYFFLIQNTIETGGSWAGVVLLLSVVVMPIARTAIIIYFLLKQAKARKRAEGVA